MDLSIRKVDKLLQVIPCTTCFQILGLSFFFLLNTFYDHHIHGVYVMIGSITLCFCLGFDLGFIVWGTSIDMHLADKLKTWPCSDNIVVKLVLLKSMKIFCKERLPSLNFLSVFKLLENE